MREHRAHARGGPEAVAGRRWRLSCAVFPTLALAALPKCPLCLMAVAGAVGLGSFVKGAWLAPLTLGCLAAALGLLALRARRRRLYAPFCLGLVSAAAILLGRSLPGYAALTYVGLALLLSASLWAGGSKGRAATRTGCEC